MDKAELDNFKNKVVVIKLSKNNEVPFIRGEFITWLRYDNVLKKPLLNHPYDIEKGWVECGETNYGFENIVEIREATDEEYNKWKKAYNKFSKEVVKEKGYDSCWVNFNEIVR